MEFVYASYGGGTNSTAELIECVNRGLKVDLILFADPGAERQETYEYIEMFSEWLVNHGMPRVISVKRVDCSGEILTLENDCLKRKCLPSLAYGFKTCSQKFKLQPQEKFLNNYPIAKEIWKGGGKITRLIGYDAGEENRAKNYEDKKYNNRYPLIEWGIDREGCKKIILEAGLNLPGKSSCFFCPSTKKHELLKMRKEHPALIERAFAMERNSELTVIPGLGRSFSWEKFIHAKESEFSLFCEYENDQMPCGCYD